MNSPEPIVICIMTDEAQCCTGRECPLYDKCFCSKRKEK